MDGSGQDEMGEQMDRPVPTTISKPTRLSLALPPPKGEDLWDEQC